MKQDENNEATKVVGGAGLSLTASEAECVARAEQKARHWHKDSKPYGNQSYADGHLAQVVALVAEIVSGPERALGLRVGVAVFLAAAWLHDAAEDTGYGLAQILSDFGDGVWRICDSVTNGPGHNRKAKQARTYPLLRERPEGKLVKLCDRLCNMMKSFTGGNLGLLAMYVGEYPYFRGELYVQGEFEELWARLDRLYEEAKELLRKTPPPPRGDRRS